MGAWRARATDPGWRDVRRLAGGGARAPIREQAQGAAAVHGLMRPRRSERGVEG